MPTSPLEKMAVIFGEFRRIRNIYKRADVGIGPYDYLFRHAEPFPMGVAFLLLIHTKNLDRSGIFL